MIKTNKNGRDAMAPDNPAEVNFTKKLAALFVAVTVMAALGGCAAQHKNEASEPDTDSSAPDSAVAQDNVATGITVSISAEGAGNDSIKMHVKGITGNGESVDSYTGVELNTSQNVPLTAGNYVLSFDNAPSCNVQGKAYKIPASQKISVTDDGNGTITFVFSLADTAEAAASNTAVAASNAAAIPVADDNASGTWTPAPASTDSASNSQDYSAPASNYGGNTDSVSTPAPVQNYTPDPTPVATPTPTPEPEPTPAPAPSGHYAYTMQFVCNDCGARFNSVAEWCAHASATKHRNADGTISQHSSYSTDTESVWVED